jgi:hypothetical protein
MIKLYKADFELRLVIILPLSNINAVSTIFLGKKRHLLIIIQIV